MTRKVLITGGAGFIGSNLAHHLLRETNATIHIVDNISRAGVSHNLNWLRGNASEPSRLEITIGDVRDRLLIERAVAAATEVYHFAAQVAVTTSITDPRLDFDVNLGGTFNVLEAARKSGHHPFMLFTSTNKVYGNMSGHELNASPTRYDYKGISGISEEHPLDFHSPYGCSKGAADQYVRDYARIYDLPAVVFRMSCIAGQQQLGNEDQGWVAHFVYSALQGNTVVIYGDGRQVRDVLNVQDLLRAFEAARVCVTRSAGQIYNIGGGAKNTTSLLEHIANVESITGKKMKLVFDESRPGDQLIYVSDFSKFKAHTGWEPNISVKQTIEHICDWWEHNKALFVDGAGPVSNDSDALLRSALPLKSA